MIAVAPGLFRRAAIALGCAVAVVVLGGCVAPPRDVFRPLPGTTGDAAWQSRRFDGVTDKAILSASAGVLQDLGFNLEESETKLGLLAASKDRTARKRQTTTQAVAQKSAEITATLLVTLLTGSPVYIGDGDPAERQVLRASLLVSPVPAPAAAPAAFDVRVSFQRIVHNRSNQVRSVETLRDPELIRAFFEALSKSTFLETHQL